VFSVWYELTVYVLFTYKLSLKRLSIGRPLKKAEDVFLLLFRSVICAGSLPGFCWHCS
jgi:hypothetical protein